MNFMNRKKIIYLNVYELRTIFNVLITSTNKYNKDLIDDKGYRDLIAYLDVELLSLSNGVNQDYLSILEIGLMFLKAKERS